MKSTDSFSGYHPAINVLYFALVLTYSMCLMHPVALLISFGAALGYSIFLSGKKTWGTLKVILPIVLLASILNPMFNHKGVTLLTYLPDGNPLTLESILYGVAASFMMAAVILWFSCFNKVMTTDKLVYLFGRIIPALSLVLSMTLRFIPRFRDQLKVVSESQKCIGRDTGSGSLLNRAKNGLTILSILVTWSLENAIETADSMKCRGYGLPGRTAFSIYRFDDRDKAMLWWLLLCLIFVTGGWLSGSLSFLYYPEVEAATVSPFSVLFFFVYLALSLTPIIVDVKEQLLWKRLKSEI